METLRAGDATVTIDHEHGGRLSSLIVGDHELLVTDVALGPLAWGCYPMVPWAGRVRRGRFRWAGEGVDLPVNLPPHAIHGTTFVRAWTPTGPGTLACDLGPAWPWPGTVHQTVTLTPTSLALTLRVEAAGAPMPVSAGWHPWFRREVGTAAVELTVPARRMWRRDDEGIPDGMLVDPPPGPWDDCFTDLTGPILLRWPEVLSLTVESDAAHVVVYDELPRAVCVEPQSAPPDAHNSGAGLATVSADDPLVVTTTWRWRQD